MYHLRQVDNGGAMELIIGTLAMVWLVLLPSIALLKMYLYYFAIVYYM